MRRRGSVRRKCRASGCGKSWTTSQRTCPKCGSESSWGYVVDVNPPGAPRKRRSKWGFQTKAKATEALEELLEAQPKGVIVEPSKQSLGEYLDRWLKAVRPQVSPSTWVGFRLHVRSYLAPLAAVPLQALTPTLIDELYADLLANGAEGGKGPLAPKSVRNAHATLHKALGDAVRKRLIPHNPAADADRPKIESSDVAVWDAEQLGQFLDGISDDRLFPLWWTYAHTGMRRGEALALRWEDVDLRAAVLRVNRNLARGPDGFVVKEPKTARGRRAIDIDPDTVQVLRDWRKAQLEERLTWGPAWEDSGLVFTREDGSPHNPDSISPAFVRLVEASGLPRITLQGLRHTHATIMLRRGVAVHVVSRRLGHASEAFTHQVYAHVLPQQGAEAAAIFAAAVKAGRRR